MQEITGFSDATARLTPLQYNRHSTGGSDEMEEEEEEAAALAQLEREGL